MAFDDGGDWDMQKGWHLGAEWKTAFHLEKKYAPVAVPAVSPRPIALRSR